MTNDELVEQNIKLVYKLAHKYYKIFNHKIEFEELCSVGSIGLVKAANDFDSSRNLKFSTLAYTYISNEIIWFYRMNKKYVNSLNFTTSLSAKIETADDLLFEDMLSSGNSTEENIISKLEIDLLYKYINELPDTERQIIMYRLQGLTMSDIGELMSYSQPQVSVIYAKAINRLRDKFLD